MAFFKAKVDGRVYEIGKLTLGDTRILKNKFGLTDLAEFSSTDPDVIVGLLSIAILRGDPSKTIDEATTEAESLDFESFSPVDDEAEVADVPLGADAAVTVVPSPSGEQETTPLTPGIPS